MHRKQLAVATAALLIAIVLSGCVGGTPQDDATAASASGAPALPALGSSQPASQAFVVVATLDTGVNPLHPTWIRDQYNHPSTFIPGYPADAEDVRLTYGEDFVQSIEYSRPELERFSEKNFPYWIPGTNIIGTWANADDEIPIFDIEAGLAEIGGGHYHGQPAASQIAGAEFEGSGGPIAMAPDAWIVIMDRTNQGGDVSVYESNANGLRWAADQDWIDIIHTNIQNPVPLARESGAPGLEGYPEAVAYAVSKGKLVVSAGGNFYAEGTETSPHAGPPGVFAAGANDNCGYADFSNPNPHTVMDGYQTVAAQASGWGTQSFGGTSSASPRTSGYASKLLLEIRKAVGDTQGFQDGFLVLLPEGADRPTSGPLSDGKLHASELHEIIRKTADPNPHDSMFDGGQGNCVPQPVESPVAMYAKMGYGEISEHTIDAAVAVALGQSVMPVRAEDAFFLASETLRTAAWAA